MTPHTIVGITADEEERIKQQLWAVLPSLVRWQVLAFGGLRRMPLRRLARLVAVHRQMEEVGR